VLIEIVRDRVEAEGTFGSLSIGGEPFCKTVEQPWRDNRPFISCIPAGDYTLIPWDSAKYGPVVCFVNPDLRVYANDADAPRDGKSHRYSCLIHAANYPSELQGCVAVGVAVVRFDHHGYGVTHSRRTLERLRAR
jgi:hypothetical protein